LIRSIFPALGNRNYALYFFGQFVSLIGTWLQTVAQGWLVLELTNSAFLVGLIAALGAAPSLLFSLFGGVIVDRFPKKHIVIFTQASSMALALILGLLTVFGTIAVWEIGVLAFLLGCVTAVDAPARQSFIPELVAKEDLASAIVLNSGTFNAARVIGPGLAGLLIALVGTGGAFLLNGASYIAVIAALFAMRVQLITTKQKLHPIAAIKEGLSYSFTHPVIRVLLIFIGVVSIFGWSYATIMPVIAKNTFHVGATGLGYLYAATGLGSVAAMFVVSALSRRVSPIVFIIGGNTLFAISIILFTFAGSAVAALPFLFFAGFGLISLNSTSNTTIQSMVADQVRGRVMSIYVLMFLGLSPIGSFEIGWLSEVAGTAFAIRVGAVVVFLFGMLVLAYRKRISEEYRRYQENAAAS